MSRITLMVNGESVTAEVAPRTHLADFLREARLLTGTHLGCEHGVCGACTLLIDRAPARSCIAFAVACDGADVCTIEGLADDPVIVRLRAAFTAERICSSVNGLVMTREILALRWAARPSSSAKPDIITTRSLGLTARPFSTRATPSRPGICTSVTRTSKRVGAACSFSSASTPSCVTTTS